MQRPMCPHCNVELKTSDIFDSEIYGDTFISGNFGECPQCKRDFRWEEIFKYSHCENLEEFKD